MTTDKEKDFEFSKKYEYDLPGEPLNPTGEPLGKALFTQPLPISSDIEPYSDKDMTISSIKYWLIGCLFMLIFGLIFEFGILGNDGKEGPLCQYLPKNKVCFYLAGPDPSLPKKPFFNFD